MILGMNAAVRPYCYNAKLRHNRSTTLVPRNYKEKETFVILWQALQSQLYLNVTQWLSLSLLPSCDTKYVPPLLAFLLI